MTKKKKEGCSGKHGLSTLSLGANSKNQEDRGVSTWHQPKGKRYNSLTSRSLGEDGRGNQKREGVILKVWKIKVRMTKGRQKRWRNPHEEGMKGGLTYRTSLRTDRMGHSES